jgi:ferredoxin
MSISIDRERCDFCGTCVAVCPVDAIELSESFLQIDEDTCTLCYACVEICPLGILEVQ